LLALAEWASACMALGQGLPVAAARAAEEAATTSNVRTLELPEKLDNYANVNLPVHFRNRAVRRFDNTPKDNPVTDAGATLGRALFYDTRLSVNNTMSCGSCHQQQHAFSDPRRFSKGHDGKEGDRNAMPLVNLRFEPSGRFFWDERAGSLEVQVLMPIQNKLEMGQDLPGLVRKLADDKSYPKLYQQAFGDQRITLDRTAKALAQFVRSLVSYRSKFDQGMAQVETVREEIPNFDRRENRGKNLFLRNCGVCHLPPGQAAVFSQTEPRNNGLDGADASKDLGKGDITLNRFDAGVFKSPSLRNVEYTAPYMHDGRFKTLEEVIDHYSTGVKNHPNLDNRLRGPRGRPRFSSEEKASLVAFLKTLSDQQFLADKRFSDPFKSQNSTATNSSPRKVP
jgi:cytochrome c peroxidase